MNILTYFTFAWIFTSLLFPAKLSFLQIWKIGIKYSVVEQNLILEVIFLFIWIRAKNKIFNRLYLMICRINNIL